MARPIKSNFGFGFRTSKQSVESTSFLLHMDSISASVTIMLNLAYDETMFKPPVWVSLNYYTSAAFDERSFCFPWTDINTDLNI